jgi:hypothetical protein
VPQSPDFDSTGWVDWLTVHADEDATDGTAPMTGASREIDGEVDTEQPAGIIQAALPGFGSMASSGDVLLVMRRGDGGIAFAVEPDPPSGAQSGDRWVKTDQLMLRLRTSKASFLDTVLSSPLAVARDTDNCNRNVAMAFWMGQVEAFINGIVPGTVTPLVLPAIADVVATTTKLESD